MIITPIKMDRGGFTWHIVTDKEMVEEKDLIICDECGLVISEMQGEDSPWQAYIGGTHSGNKILCYHPFTGDGGCIVKLEQDEVKDD